MTDDDEMQMVNAEGGDSDQLLFKGGKEFIYENDEYLHFNPEESELKNNPAFGYLGMTFDKEGTRGLIINDLDIGEDKIQKLDIFKYNREIDMESYRFQNREGSVMLLEDTQEFLEDLNTLNEKSRKARLLPQLTKFCTEHSEKCRKDFGKFMIYSAKEFQKYRDGGAADPSKEKFFDIIGGLNYEQDFDMQIPDVTQYTQGFGQKQRNSQYERDDFGFDQPIGRFDSDTNFGTQVISESRPLMQEINDVLRNIPAVLDDFDMRSNTGAGMQDYNDFGGFEAIRSRNPDDYMTPNLDNVFERAAKKLASVEQSMKSYNMRTELRRPDTHLRSASELFGPSNLSLNREKLARIKRIIGPKENNDNSQSAQPRKQKAALTVDFNLDPLDQVPNAASVIERMLAQENARMPKRSKARNLLTDVTNETLHTRVLAIEQKFQLPPEIEISGSTFNSLFTRDLQEFDLKAQMNQLLERDRKEEIHLLRDGNDPEQEGVMYSPPRAFHDEDPLLADPASQVYGGMNLEQPDFDFAGGADGTQYDDPDMRPQVFEVQGDLVGMNLIKNYMNFQQEAAISNLEKKLSQTYNFKISTFKSHVQNKYLSFLAPDWIERAKREGNLPGWIESQRAMDGSVHQGVRFSRVCRELIGYWKKHHDVEVTLQACFLTILHLCTENSLFLFKCEHQDNDFIICSTGTGVTDTRNFGSRVQGDAYPVSSQMRD